jgi:hypothetical protein
MEKIIFAFEDSIANLSAYEKLKFSISIDDAINKIYYVEANLTNYDWMAVLALLEDCKWANLQPILQFGEELINWEDAIAYADEKAANELTELI